MKKARKTAAAAVLAIGGLLMTGCAAVTAPWAPSRSFTVQRSMNNNFDVLGSRVMNFQTYANPATGKGKLSNNDYRYY